MNKQQKKKIMARISKNSRLLEASQNENNRRAEKSTRGEIGVL